MEGDFLLEVEGVLWFELHHHHQEEWRDKVTTLQLVRVGTRGLRGLRKSPSISSCPRKYYRIALDRVGSRWGDTRKLPVDHSGLAMMMPYSMYKVMPIASTRHKQGRIPEFQA